LTICLFLPIQYTNVTDRQTDGNQTTAHAALCTVARGNKISTTVYIRGRNWQLRNLPWAERTPG